ncbi:MAG: hypothetical protein JW969_04100 [Spirochaetales bacterium]|nr:hypothetical protein [Spirochaetales bacterium]
MSNPTNQNSTHNNNKKNFNKNRRKNFSRRHDRFRSRKNRSRRPLENCTICSKPIHDIYSAINFLQNDKPAHFECIIKEIEKTEELKPNEKICYLGQGSFGIVTIKNNANPFRFFIRKRIQYENVEAIPPWRQKLPIRVK